MTSNVDGFSSDGDEEDDESSSSPFQMKDVQTVLNEFRQNWQNEIKHTNQPKLTSGSKVGGCKNELTSPIDEDVEAKAERLFKQGIELEDKGKVYDALLYYRRAVQLVPDIEFRIYELSKRQIASTKPKEERSSAAAINDSNRNLEEMDSEDLEGVDLYDRFQTQLGSKLIHSSLSGRGVLSTQLHISDLPNEIILFILKWVVSNQLDMISLEQVAMTCKGLYLCARDEEIWKLACLKVWGLNTGDLTDTTYTSWRDMYVRRERIHFNGCYISKTSYLRYGENSFQDEFYRPVQIILYYRYVRFLPDGTVFLMTNADEPSTGVNKLRHLQSLRPDVLKGRWRLNGNVVSIVCTKSNQLIPRATTATGKRRGSLLEMDTPTVTTYYIELLIIGSSKRKFCQLQWKKYSLIQKKKTEITTDFDLTASKFPPLWFSKVKSYHLEAEAPLQ